MYILIIQRIFLEAVLDIFYFPIWWYTSGAVKAATKCLELLKFGNDRLAPSVWLINIFVPMFGQYDWQGRMISFVMRLVQIIFRGLALLVWLGVCFVVFLVWLLIPLVIAMGFFNIFYPGLWSPSIPLN